MIPYLDECYPFPELESIKRNTFELEPIQPTYKLTLNPKICYRRNAQIDSKLFNNVTTHDMGFETTNDNLTVKKGELPPKNTAPVNR